MTNEAERPYPFWRYLDLLLFFGLAAPCIVLAQLLVIGAAKLMHAGASPQTLMIPAQFVGYAFLFLTLYAVFKVQYRAPFWRSLGWVPFRLPLSTTVLLGPVLAFTLVALGALLKTPNVETPLKDLLARRGTAILVGLFATTAGPICEELAFRGFMQPLLVRSLGATPGILLTALAFGMLHLQQYGFSWRHGLLITFAGAAFGAMRHFSGSTRASTWMHAAYNATLFVPFFAAPVTAQ